MEQLDHADTGATDGSQTSSIYSTDTLTNAQSLDTSDKTHFSHKRQAPSIPSYMNAPIPRKPVASKTIGNGTPTTSKNKPPKTPPPVPTGVLLLAIAAHPHPSTISYLRSMLKKALYKEIVILGDAENEDQLKQLKVDVYALLGKLGKELSVQMDLRSNWAEAEISTAMLRVIANGDEIRGVLCSPSYDNDGPSELNIMALKQAQLESPWKSSVGFLHGVAKGAMPNLLSDGHEYKKPGLFLVTSPTEDSPTSILYNAAIRTLMTVLVEANSGRHLTIDYAENVLIPELETGNTNDELRVTSTLAPDAEHFSVQESPTKLWMNWEQSIEFMPG